MKPTQEQVIAWAREADFWQGEIQNSLDLFLRLATLAYEAGRKDENEACIDTVAWHGGGVEIEAAIRARREQ